LAENDSKIKDLTEKTTLVNTDEWGGNDVVGGDVDKKFSLLGVKKSTICVNISGIV